MRVVNFLFTSIFLFVVVVVVGGLVGREVLLNIGSSMIRSSLTVLHKVSRDNLQYARLCREKGGITLELATIGALQLRFINDREFVIEVICSQFVSDPIMIERYTLPPFVQKTAGSGGIIWGTERSAVEIEIFGRRQIVGIEGEEIKNFGSGGVSLGLSPQTTCEGYGYQCCQPETFSGVGDPFNSVTDCPKTCFSACLPRPVVLSMNADPFPDDSRTVRASKGETITFTYVASYEENQPVTVTLDLGDGQQKTNDALTGKTNHQYVCNSATCNYTVQLRVRAANGVESVDTPITQLKVVIE